MDTAGHVEDIRVRTEGVFGIGAHETVIPASDIRALGADLITVEGHFAGEETVTTRG
jgi:hypothetical protein